MRTLTGAIVLLAIAFTGAASAATPVARDDVTAGPVLSGSRVVWGSTAPAGSLVIRAAVPGERPETLFSFAAPERPTTQLIGGLAASATHLAVTRVATRITGEAPKAGAARSLSETAAPIAPAASSTTLVAGPVGGPFVHLAGRRGPVRPGRSCRPVWTPSGPVLSGSMLAYLEHVTSCTKHGEMVHNRVVVRDLARLAARPRVVARTLPYPSALEPPRSLGAVRIAGRYVAWLEQRGGADTSATVLDLRSGKTVRNEDRAPGGEPGDVLEWFDVGSDGSLVVSFQLDETGHALALLPRDGRGGTVEMRPARGTTDYEPSTERIFLRGGRIGFLSELGPGKFGLVLARRTGRPAPLARFTARRPVVGDIAWSGTYAAWASRRGKTTTLWRSGPHR